MSAPLSVPEQTERTIQQLRVGTAATRMDLVALDMRTLTRGLAATMPGKMDALIAKVDTWTEAVTSTARLLREMERDD